MTPERQLKRNLRTISWTIGVIFLLSAAIFSAIFLFARRDQLRLAEDQLARHTVLLDLQGAIGYGGMVHHFKNWVLRPGETRYRDEALDAADRALALLDRLEAMLEQDGDNLPLAAQRAAIGSYKTNIATVSALHAAGTSSREIDHAVRVSDSEALGELSVVRDRMVARMRAQQAALTDRRNIALLIPSMLLVILLCCLLLLVRQRARLRLEHGAARIDEIENFTQIAAHDLRAPLRQIRALAEFAAEELETGEPEAEGLIGIHLATISERAVRLEELIKAVFRYLQVDGAAQEVTEVDLRALAEELGDLHLPHGELCLEGAFPTVRAQRVELEIILRNLISNAVKHHPDHSPRIILRHWMEGRNHRFEVEDDGPGIAPEHAARVFDMFWSLKASGAAQEVSGVGLALVRRIVTGWGTEISLRAAAPHGAVFSFTMPSGGRG